MKEVSSTRKKKLEIFKLPSKKLSQGMKEK